MSIFNNPARVKKDASMMVFIIDARIDLKEPPQAGSIEAVGDTVDALHEHGYHEHAHRLDDAMCRWSELLL